MGYVGTRPVAKVLVDGLRRLEYRGYDSAGVALQGKWGIEIVKSEGKLTNVERLLSNFDASGVVSGIGHTRWATHGKPTTQNAHPHQTGHVVLVHNGIIENYQEIHRALFARGHRPQTETDTELFGFLVLEKMDAGDNLADAVRKSFLELEGSCSVVVMSEKEPGVLVGVRNGSPLVIAKDPQGGSILASDAQPLVTYTQDVIFLDHGDCVVVTQGDHKIIDLKTGKAVDRRVTSIDWTAEKLDKHGFHHYMLKEIFEQPNAMVDTLNGLLDRKNMLPFQLAEQPGVGILGSASSLELVACGSAYHAALLGKYWIEKLAGIPVNVELASEFLYRNPVIPKGAVVLAVSQSGETADTLAVIRQMKKRGLPTLGITNVRGSSLSRETDAVFFMAAGPEIGVAATKTFTAQMLTLFSLAGYLGMTRSMTVERESLPGLFDEFLRIPHTLATLLQPESAWVRSIQETAKRVSGARGFFFIGRGFSYPIALEGALKLKEIAYIHAEGYAGGELKHGPIAMIDDGMVVVVLSPKDIWHDKTLSNLQEVKARGARILGVGDVSDVELKSQCDEWVPLPSGGSRDKNVDQGLYPFLETPVVQLLSYEIAVLRGTDIDQPRNLAKSVTVE